MERWRPDLDIWGKGLLDLQRPDVVCSLRNVKLEYGGGRHLPRSDRCSNELCSRILPKQAVADKPIAL